jgi:hypothetical protein
MKPTPAKPRIDIAQVDGSGTALMPDTNPVFEKEVQAPVVQAPIWAAKVSPLSLAMRRGLTNVPPVKTISNEPVAVELLAPILATKSKEPKPSSVPEVAVVVGTEPAAIVKVVPFVTSKFNDTTSPWKRKPVLAEYNTSNVVEPAAPPLRVMVPQPAAGHVANPFVVVSVRISAWAELVKAKAPVAINNPVKIEQNLDVWTPLTLVGATHCCAFVEKVASQVVLKVVVKSRYKIAAESRGKKITVKKIFIKLSPMVNAVDGLRQ